MFKNIYENKKIVITGHTGFKGGWLCTWLCKLGADVVGVSNGIPTNPALFNELSLQRRIKHCVADVRDLQSMCKIIEDEKPDFVFHLAAQAIVSASYSEPVDTFSTNVLGSVHVLEALRKADSPCVLIMITSDKCYNNVEWIWGYRESDGLGGKDVYSGSKGAAELAIKSYYHSFFNSPNSPVRVAVGRAGNVIGGGDWAKDRIVVDCMRSWSDGRSVEIRSPEATRPWQHVLEPLSGYLTLGQSLFADDTYSGEAFNFGPRAERNQNVEGLLKDLSEQWGFETTEEAYRVTDNIAFNEAGLLKLNCDKALYHLNWEANLEYEETIQFVSDWYYKYYRKEIDIHEYTIDQITQFESLGESRERIWSKP